VELLGEARPFRPRQVWRVPATRELRPLPAHARFVMGGMGVAAMHGRSPPAGMLIWSPIEGSEYSSVLSLPLLCFVCLGSIIRFLVHPVMNRWCFIVDLK
jgi:hypothetical protein